jgi:hypothetical protein
MANPPPIRPGASFRKFPVVFTRKAGMFPVRLFFLQRGISQHLENGNPIVGARDENEQSAH